MLPFATALLRLAAALRAGDLAAARLAQRDLTRVRLADLDAEARATLYAWRWRLLPGGPLRGLQADVAEEAEAAAWPRMTPHQRLLLAVVRSGEGLEPEPRPRRLRALEEGLAEAVA